MTSEQFVFWLQGALEIMDPKSLNEQQIKVIKDHIALVLTKVTPNYINDPNTFRVHPEPFSPTMPVYPWPPTTTSPIVTCGSSGTTTELPVDTTAGGASGTLVDSQGSTLLAFTDEQKDKIRQAVDKLSDKQRMPRRPGVYC